MSDDISRYPQPATQPMAPVPAGSAALEASRAHTIRVLTDRFADDTLSLEEFESRLDLMYKAGTTQELDTLLREVESRVPRVGTAPLPATGYEMPIPRRLLALMSSTRRAGRWAMPRQLELRAVMSDIKLDLREVVLPAGVCELDSFSLMANIEILVPLGVVVEDMTLSVMSNVENDALDDGRAPAGAPRIRFVGTAIMSNIEVRVAPAGLPTAKAWKEAKRMRRRGGWPTE